MLISSFCCSYLQVGTVRIYLYEPKNGTLVYSWAVQQSPLRQATMYDYNESEGPTVMSNSLRPHGLYSSWNSPGQNTGAGSLSLLQGIFPTHRSNPRLPHCRQILYQQSHKGSCPRILEWVAYPFSSGSSQPRN